MVHVDVLPDLDVHEEGGGRENLEVDRVVVEEGRGEESRRRKEEFREFAKGM
jgi:hypothetical protein